MQTKAALHSSSCSGRGLCSDSALSRASLVRDSIGVRPKACIIPAHISRGQREAVRRAELLQAGIVRRGRGRCAGGNSSSSTRHPRYDRPVQQDIQLRRLLQAPHPRRRGFVQAGVLRPARRARYGGSEAHEKVRSRPTTSRVASGRSVVPCPERRGRHGRQRQEVFPRRVVGDRLARR